MKKALKAIGIILCVLIIIILIFAYIQRDNISAFIDAMRYDNEQIVEKISENDKALKDEIEGYLSEKYREYTQEEKEQIARGDVSEKEVLAKIIAEKNASEGANKKSSAGIISSYVSELYAMEDRYIAGIEGVLARAKADYKKEAKSKRDATAIANISERYIGEIESMEARCDSEVEALLVRLKNELDSIKADTSIISTIRNAYENEKQLKRSYYISKYMK